jgi:hypothetical protein
MVHRRFTTVGAAIIAIEMVSPIVKQPGNPTDRHFARQI